MRAIDPSKNQPNRRRCDRARACQRLVGTFRLTGRFERRRALDAIAARRLDARAGLHALNHALLALAPLFVLCDPGDVATEHVYPFQTRPRPFRAIVYDARPGGLGVAEELYHRMGALLREARTLLACPCGLATGCPACLHDGRCTGHNVALDRDAARLIVDALLDRGDLDEGAPAAKRPRLPDGES